MLGASAVPPPVPRRPLPVESCPVREEPAVAQPSALRINEHTLAAIDFFAATGAELRRAVAHGLQAFTLGVGEPAFVQHQRANDVFFVVSGQVRVTFYSERGREVAFLDLGPGAMFGELAALDDGPRSAHVEATTPCVLARMAQADFIALLGREPELARRVMRQLAAAVRRLTERVIEFSTIGVRERLYAELLRIARHGDVRNAQVLLGSLPTHAELANRISTHREAVSREMSALKRADLLRKVTGGWLLTDLARLEQLVAAATAT